MVGLAGLISLLAVWQQAFSRPVDSIQIPADNLIHNDPCVVTRDAKGWAVDWISMSESTLIKVGRDLQPRRFFQPIPKVVRYSVL